METPAGTDARGRPRTTLRARPKRPGSTVVVMTTRQGSRLTLLAMSLGFAVVQLHVSA